MTVARLLGGALPRRQAARLVRLPGVGRARDAAIPLALGTAAANPDRPTVAICGDGGFLMAGPRAPDGARRGARVRRPGRERLRLRHPAQLPGDDVRPHGRGRAERARLRAASPGRAACATCAPDGIGGLAAALGEASPTVRAGARRAAGRAQSSRPVASTRGNPGSPASPLLRLAWLPRRCGETRSSPSHDGLAHAEASGPDPTGLQLFHTPHHEVRQASTPRRR